LGTGSKSRSELSLCSRIFCEIARLTCSFCSLGYPTAIDANPTRRGRLCSCQGTTTEGYRSTQSGSKTRSSIFLETGQRQRTSTRRSFTWFREAYDSREEETTTSLEWNDENFPFFLFNLFEYYLTHISSLSFPSFSIRIRRLTILDHFLPLTLQLFLRFLSNDNTILFESYHNHRFLPPTSLLDRPTPITFNGVLLIRTLDVLETEVLDPTRQDEVFIRSCKCVQASLGQSWGNSEDGNESNNTLVDC